jgi:hypothetical protein
MPLKCKIALLDADFAIKLGRVESQNIIEDIIPEFVELLYIHRHVNEKEILTPAAVKKQVDSLVRQKRAIIVDRQFISAQDGSKELIYDQVISLLKTKFWDSKKPRKNWGEIVSLAFAKTDGVTVFLSDESDLQDIIDEHLNLEDANDIRVVKIKDFIEWMKAAGSQRKLCRIIWLVSGEVENLKQRKEQFDGEIWPLE